MKQLAYLFVLLVAVIGLSSWLQKGDVSKVLNLGPSQTPTTYTQVLKVKNTTVMVEIVATPEKLAQGLSGRDGLAENIGMLFVVAQNTRPTFWMKDMKFPIDIIWINDNMVVGIEKNVPIPQDPNNTSSLERYSPSTGVDYVLEVESGFTQKNSIAPGDEVELPQTLR